MRRTGNFWSVPAIARAGWGGAGMTNFSFALMTLSRLEGRADVVGRWHTLPGRRGNRGIEQAPARSGPRWCGSAASVDRRAQAFIRGARIWRANLVSRMEEILLWRHNWISGFRFAGRARAPE